MFHRLREYLNDRKFGATTLAVVALSFLLAGFAAALGLHWTGSSWAEGLGSGAQGSTVATVIPSSFADLAEKLGPTVVNIKVTKVEKVGAFQWPQVPKDSKGALVGDVVPGSPAEKAGIRRGDVIVAFNGKAVQDAHDLPSMVAATPVGREVTVTILRDGVEHQLPIRVGKLPSEETAVEGSGQPSQGTWGLLLQDLNPLVAGQLGLTADHGVVVVGVQPGSPADLAGVHQGDIILEVNRQPVKSVKEVREVIAKANGKEPLLLLVKRDQGNFFVALSK